MQKNFIFLYFFFFIQYFFFHPMYFKLNFLVKISSFCRYNPYPQPFHHLVHLSLILLFSRLIHLFLHDQNNFPHLKLMNSLFGFPHPRLNDRFLCFFFHFHHEIFTLFFLFIVSIVVIRGDYSKMSKGKLEKIFICSLVSI